MKDVGVILDRHNIDFTPQCVTVSMNPTFFPVKFGMKTVIPEQVVLSANTNAEMLCGSTVRLLVHSQECDACAWGERVRVGGRLLVKSVNENCGRHASHSVTADYTLRDYRPRTS